MTARAFHRTVGLVMLLPFVCWAVTGAIFFLKPGYAGAYEPLSVRTYPLDAPVTLEPNPSWLELRYLKTILGEHLLVRTASGWQQLDPATGQTRPEPPESDLRRLLNDAFSVNPSRYGHVVSVSRGAFTTDTGVRGTIGWTRLALMQRGADTDRIDWIYRIHYLQWTGVEAVDRVLGAAGLGGIVLLSLLGVRLLVKKKPVP